MKELGIVIAIVFKFSIGHCQISPLTLKEGSFRNSIEWYIETTTSYVNNLTPEIKIKSLNQLGVVALRFVNVSDSIRERKSKQLNGAVEFVHHPRFQFEILIEAKHYVIKYPPSHYFVLNGVVICVYDGIERFIQFKEKDLEIFERQVKQGKVVHIQAQKKYLITIDEALENGFMALSLEQRVD